MTSNSSGAAGGGLYNSRHYDYDDDEVGMYRGGEDDDEGLVKMFILDCANKSETKTKSKTKAEAATIRNNNGRAYPLSAVAQFPY